MEERVINKENNDMMKAITPRRYAEVVGTILAVLALLGLAAGDNKILGMNSDLAMDIVRLVVAVILLYAGFIAQDKKTVAGIVYTVGAVYLAIGILGMITRTLFGILPNGLTGLDITFHIIVGAIGLYSAASHTHEHTVHQSSMRG